jgi:hypothetical protein
VLAWHDAVHGDAATALIAAFLRAGCIHRLRFDNESDHRLPHRTTKYGPSAGASGGPWLVSMVMWFNCMRFVTEEGIAAREVERLARTRTNWDGMRRWGYVFFELDPADKRPKPPQSALIGRARPHKACGSRRNYGPLVSRRSRSAGASDSAWRMIDALRSALAAVVNQLDVTCLTVSPS